MTENRRKDKIRERDRPGRRRRRRSKTFIYKSVAVQIEWKKTSDEATCLMEGRVREQHVSLLKSHTITFLSLDLVLNVGRTMVRLQPLLEGLASLLWQCVAPVRKTEVREWKWRRCDVCEEEWQAVVGRGTRMVERIKENGDEEKW